MKKLFIIGNGFDLDHNMPTSLGSYLREIVENSGDSDFWFALSSFDEKFWSDFESKLASPDIDAVFDILIDYAPDYSSDFERNRDAIIQIAMFMGKVQKHLKKFVKQANNFLLNEAIKPKSKYSKLFGDGNYFINFNYTHTLEMLYSILDDNTLHLHGSLNSQELIIGYKESEWSPTSDSFNIDESDDYYVCKAYECVTDTLKSFSKKIQIDKLIQFLEDIEIEEIVIIGFSFGQVDSCYFDLLFSMFGDAKITVTYHDEYDLVQKKRNIDKYYDGFNFCEVKL